MVLVAPDVSLTVGLELVRGFQLPRNNVEKKKDPGEYLR